MPPSLTIKTQIKDIPPWQADDDSENDDDDGIYESENIGHDDYEYDDDMMLDHASSVTSSPSIPDENIDFDSVYALHAFVATVEGQVNARKGDALLLMEDENTYWWLVEVLHTGEIGYIPAENIETPYERLARLNKHRNIDNTIPLKDGTDIFHPASAGTRRYPKNLFVEFGPSEVIEFEPETEEEMSDEQEDEYEWEDMDNDTRYYEEEYDDRYERAYNNYDDIEELQDHIEHQPEKVRNLLHERIKDRQLEEKRRNEIYQAINESHDSSALDSIESESVSSSDEDEIEMLNINERISSEDRVVMHNISKPKPPVRLVESRTSCSSLEITEVNPTSQTTTKIVKREVLPRSKSKDSIMSCHTQLTVLRVFAGNIKQGTGFKTVMVNANTTAQELVKQAMVKFHIEDLDGETAHSEYYATVKGIDGHESTLDPEDKPLSIFQTLTNHLTTPMPSLEHIKRLSNTQQAYVMRLGVMEKDKSYQPIASHFGEDSVIRFYLHKRMKRASDRIEQVYIKISLFLDSPVPNLGSVGKTSGFLSSRKKKYTATMAEDANRVDKIICVNMKDLVSEVIYIALDKFHITNGVPDGPKDSGYIPEDLVRYRLLVQNSGSEIELNYRETMRTVMECYRMSNEQDGHLTFILRKAGVPVKSPAEPKKYASLRIKTPGRSGSESSTSLSPALEIHRRPSILDILMETPKSIDSPHTSYYDILHDSPHPSEKNPSSDGQRNDRMFSNSSHLLSDMSESRKSSFTSFTSNDNHYKTVRSVSTTPTSPLELPNDRSRQLSLTSFASSSSMNSDEAQKNSSTSTVNYTAEQYVVEKREKGFGLSFRKMVPWSNKTKRVEPSQEDYDNRQYNGTAKQMRSTMTVEPINSRTIYGNTYRETNPALDALLVRPTVNIESASIDSITPFAASNSNTSDISPATNFSKPSDEDGTNYASYAKWLNSLPPPDVTDTFIHENSMNKARKSSKDGVDPSLEEPYVATGLNITEQIDKQPSKSVKGVGCPDKNNSRKEKPSILEPVHNPELGELSYLITNGIGFLETKESSKWEDDGGYEFHPWNKSKATTAQTTKVNAEEVEELSIGENSNIQSDSTNPVDKTNKRKGPMFTQKAPIIEAKTTEQELARIVAAHIVF
ncbi:hypothetical protein INT43_005214 [Umbelopsis isabellina]|uniref:SH3 domain-containing protein n=1 Tax=Mortierella isabellina TaxID=91625 RepID=A0A8H7PHR9_MORIS|nr:hypothetical protein INT43_005214 [Umbelopsis isabellina]